MPEGFFDLPTYEPKTTLSTLIPACGACKLYCSPYIKSPKMKPSGKGRRKILIVGEGSWSTEDSQGIQFVGKTGQLLEQTLAKFDVDMREDCWITNSVICSSFSTDGKHRNPTDKEVDHCRPNLIQTINELQPEVVILLGGKAVHSLIPYLWKPDDIGSMERWIGWQIPSQKVNSWIIPAWHPSFVSRLADEKNKGPIAKLIWERHLKSAFSLEGRPWKRIPDYKKQVQVIINQEEASRAITDIMNDGLPVAFDYETTGLKPDSDKIEIFTCAISNGKKTIAYPWHGRAIEATKACLQSDLPKIAANLKFEERYSIKKLGIEVKNWAFDTMIAAHVLDNRPSISSLKFQAFVLLGQPSYDDHIKPFLQAKGSNSVNKVKECDLRQLLIYNGLDALLEFRIAKIQSEQLGVEL